MDVMYLATCLLSLLNTISMRAIMCSSAFFAHWTAPLPSLVGPVMRRSRFDQTIFKSPDGITDQYFASCSHHCSVFRQPLFQTYPRLIGPLVVPHRPWNLCPPSPTCLQLGRLTLVYTIESRQRTHFFEMHIATTSSCILMRMCFSEHVRKLHSKSEPAIPLLLLWQTSSLIESLGPIRHMPGSWGWLRFFQPLSRHFIRFIICVAIPCLYRLDG